MSIIEQYHSLAGQRRFTECLPLIEEIVRSNPDLASNHFTYGICLAELRRHQDAARAFLQAYKLDPDNDNALHRGCLALAAADDAPALLEVFRHECSRNPMMLHHFVDEKPFARFWESPAFKSFREEQEAS
jgi:tetratricopeptide (TPR) repeat protein